MALPYYVSPEQMMADKAEYAKKGIAKGRSIVAMEYADGVLLVADNPSASLHKIAEMYDRKSCAATRWGYPPPAARRRRIPSRRSSGPWRSPSSHTRPCRPSSARARRSREAPPSDLLAPFADQRVARLGDLGLFKVANAFLGDHLHRGVDAADQIRASRADILFGRVVQRLQR